MNGTDVLVLVEDPATPGTYLTVGSQRDASMEEETETIDRSSKESRARRVRAGRYSATIELEALYVPSDAGYTALADAMRNGTAVKLRRSEAGTDVEEADAIVTSLSHEFPDQDEATVSASFEIDGEWSEVPAAV